LTDDSRNSEAASQNPYENGMSQLIVGAGDFVLDQGLKKAMRLRGGLDG
jgi:hypothetical protein